MTNNEVTAEIYKHMEAIRKLYTEFSPDNVFLSLCVNSNGRISFNNTWWELEENKKIDFWEGYL